MGGVCSTADTKGDLGDIDSNAFADAPADSPAPAPAPAPSQAATASHEDDNPQQKTAVGADVKLTDTQADAVKNASHLRAKLGQKVGSPSFLLPVFPFLNCKLQLLQAGVPTSLPKIYF